MLKIELVLFALFLKASNIDADGLTWKCVESLMASRTDGGISVGIRFRGVLQRVSI